MPACVLCGFVCVGMWVCVCVVWCEVFICLWFLLCVCVIFVFLGMTLFLVGWMFVYMV